jgi:para-aminobenzoate synthetase component I
MFLQRSSFSFAHQPDFYYKALAFAQKFDVCCLTDGNFPLFSHYPHQPFKTMLAIGAAKTFDFATDSDQHQTPIFDALAAFQQQAQDWVFGFLGYDLKNSIENLQSNNQDKLQFPASYFFVPQHLIIFEDTQIFIHSFDKAAIIFEEINKEKTYNLADFASPNHAQVVVQNSLSKAAYIEKIEQIKQDIVNGEVYELNFCMNFFAENIQLNPFFAYLQLKSISPMPFAAFFKCQDQYLLCASPERFLKKEGQKIISQPIKGTTRRGKTVEEDEILKQQLRNSEKEIAENMMIVDLVRNDFARTAKTGTIKVEELFGIYSFSQVSQMISTVVAEVADTVPITDIIKAAFPMGSMTGAPKVRAMQLIEDYETDKRGLFSGAIGYFSPAGDFDFNVVIRSIFYLAAQKYVSFMAGSAITYDSEAEKEYEECLLKTNAIRKVLEKIYDL